MRAAEKEKPETKKITTPTHLDPQHIVIGCLVYHFDTVLAGDVPAPRYFVTRIKPEYFTSELARKVFHVISTLALNAEPVESTVIYAQLKKTEKNIAEYLSQFTKWVSTTHIVSLEMYVRRLQAGFVKRKLAKIGQNLASIENDEFHEADSVIESAEATLLAITDAKEKIEELRQAGTFVDSVCEAVLNSDSELTGDDTGYTFLNWKLLGWRPKELTLIAARPSVGKTAFALDCTLKQAKRGKKIAFFSLEMSEQEIVKRLISQLSGIAVHDWKRFPDEIHAASVEIKKLRIYIDGSTELTPVDFLSKALTLKKRVGLDFVFIDYLQLMSANSSYENTNAKMAEISRRCKLASRALDCPVIALSQLSRKGADRKGEEKRPMLSDLRDSGALEQDADNVIFLHRQKPRTMLQPYESEGLELIIEKARNAMTGITTIDFQPSIFTFRERG